MMSILVLLVKPYHKEWQGTEDVLNTKQTNYIPKCEKLELNIFFIRLVQELPECQNVEQLRKKEGEIIIEL